MTRHKTPETPSLPPLLWLDPRPWTLNLPLRTRLPRFHPHTPLVWLAGAVVRGVGASRGRWRSTSFSLLGKVREKRGSQVREKKDEESIRLQVDAHITRSSRWTVLHNQSRRMFVLFTHKKAAWGRHQSGGTSQRWLDGTRARMKPPQSRRQNSEQTDFDNNMNAVGADYYRTLHI